MKITKTNKDAEWFAEQKRKANKGCDVCPCCGESKNFIEYMRQGIANKGVVDLPIAKSWCGGFFMNKFYKIDCYSCKTCGAKWESDKYRYA